MYAFLYYNWSLSQSFNIAAKILPVAYGIKKLQISCVVEDDKIGTDFLEENILAFEDLVSTSLQVKFYWWWYCLGTKCWYSGF